MSTGFWGINLITDKQRRKAKTIVFLSNSFYDCFDIVNEMEEQLSVLYPNSFIILHFCKDEEYNKTQKTIFKQD